MQPNLEAFFSNPKEFLNIIAAQSNKKPDFGINQLIMEAFQTNPEKFSSFPVINLLTDITPNQFVRFRCSMLTELYPSYIPLKYIHDGQVIVPILSDSIPEEGLPDKPDPNFIVKMTSRICQSFNTDTAWQQQPWPAGDQSKFLHLNFVPPEPIIRTSDYFQAVVKCLFEVSNRPGQLVDFIGFFEEPDPIDDSIIPAHEYEDTFYSALPHFQAFAMLPASFVPSNIPALSGRDVIISFLSSIFSPIQAELFFLWLIGHVRERVVPLPLGIFSLNLSCLSPEAANTIIELVNFLCTSVQVIDFSCSQMNCEKFQPRAEEELFITTPLSITNGTRLIVNETCLEEGQLDQTGIENLNLIMKLTRDQVIPYDFDGSQRDIETSIPVLVLSSTPRSLIKCDIVIPVDQLRSTADVIEGSLVAMRKYVEEIRYQTFRLSTEMNDLILPVMSQLMGSNKNLQQTDFITFMNLIHLTCISYGVDTLSAEQIQHVSQLFLTAMSTTYK